MVVDCQPLPTAVHQCFQLVTSVTLEGVLLEVVLGVAVELEGAALHLLLVCICLFLDKMEPEHTCPTHVRQHSSCVCCLSQSFCVCAMCMCVCVCVCCVCAVCVCVCVCMCVCVVCVLCVCVCVCVVCVLCVCVCVCMCVCVVCVLCVCVCVCVCVCGCVCVGVCVGFVSATSSLVNPGNTLSTGHCGKC